MTQRQWLIRTKANKILGPLPKEKVIEFVQDGTLTDEDEICMGNGYWFWIKEDDLLNRYLFGDELQSFNPVCEATTKVANSVSKLVKTSGIVDKITQEAEAPVNNETPVVPTPVAAGEEETLLPEEDDLDFPEPIDYSDTKLPEPEAVKSQEPPKIVKSEEPQVENQEDDEETILPDSSDLDFPDIGGDTSGPTSEEAAPIIEEDSTGEIELPSPSQETPVVEENENFPELPDLEEADELDIADEVKAVLEKEKEELKDQIDQVEIEEEIPEPMKAVEMPRPPKKKVSKKKVVKKKKKKNDYSFIYVAVIILIVLLFFISKFYSKLVGKELFSTIKMPTSQVYAQEFRVSKKKRYF